MYYSKHLLIMYITPMVMIKDRSIRLLVMCLVIFSVVAISGCTESTQVTETMPEDVIILKVSPIRLIEGESGTILVDVANNGSGSLEGLKIESLSGFSIGSNGSVNVPGKVMGEDKPTSQLSAMITAPGFKNVVPNSTLTLTYESNGDKIKSVEIPVKVLPGANLQFVGFAATEDRIRMDRDEEITTKKAGTIYVTFSVRNDGQTTIDPGTLKVMVDVKEDSMGQDNEMTVDEGMARNGTSYTLSVPITVPDTAPNGETDVEVKLLTVMGHDVLDSKMLTLIAKL